MIFSLSFVKLGSIMAVTRRLIYFQRADVDISAALTGPIHFVVEHSKKVLISESTCNVDLLR